MLYVGLMFIFAKSPQSSALNTIHLLKWFPFGSINPSLIIVYIRKTIHVIGYLSAQSLYLMQCATPVLNVCPI